KLSNRLYERLIAFLVFPDPFEQSVILVYDIPFPFCIYLYLDVVLQTLLLQFHVAIHIPRSEEHTSELQSRFDLVCRLLLEKKKYYNNSYQSNNTVYSHTLKEDVVLNLLLN